MLEREKWLWHSGFDDFVPPFFSGSRFSAPATSLGSCWGFGLWTDEAWPYSWNHPAVHPLLARAKISCYRILGMEDAALDACRQMLLMDPAGEAGRLCIDTIVEILILGGNTVSALAFYERLDPAQQERLSPESLYLLAHSGYLLHRDEEASSLVERIPPDAEPYPLAVYLQVQIAFRSGDGERARSLLSSLIQGDPNPHVPDVLQEQAGLTLARILFQEKKYEDAARVFRGISRGRYFRPEALMGLGWSYEAMGRPAGAIAFFEAAQEAAERNVLAQSQAELERARLHAENGLHADAARIFQEAQERMEAYIRFLDAAAQDPAWAMDQARNLLPAWMDGHDTIPPEPEQGLSNERMPPLDPKEDRSLRAAFPAFKEEITAVLEKESYLSHAFLELYAIRDALLQVRSLADHPLDPEDRFPFRRGISTRPTPPLDTRHSLLLPETIRRLDASFALLDTEYRLHRAKERRGHTGPEERNLFFREALAFYTTTLPVLILDAPPDPQQDAGRTLEGIMTLVRHLPHPAEDRRRILQKLLHTQRALQQGEQTLLSGIQTMEEAGTGVTPPSRRLLLRLWMRYAATLLYLETWQDRSPSVFLVPSITLESAADPEPPSRRDARGGDVLADRMSEVWQRLGTSLQAEILRFCAERRAAFDTLLTTSELYYAEALLKHHEFLLQELQLLPEEAEYEATPEETFPELLPPEPSTNETQPGRREVPIGHGGPGTGPGDDPNVLARGPDPRPPCT